MLLAETTKDTLLAAFWHVTQSLSCPVSNALATLDGNLGTAFVFASLACRAVCRTHTRLFDALVTSWMLACLAFSAVADTAASLYDTVGTVGEGTCATRSFLHICLLSCGYQMT